MMASDGVGFDEESFTLTVTNTNRQPSVVSVTDQALFEGTAWELLLAGNDPDGDSLTYSHTCATACPAGLSLDGATGQFSWTPANDANEVDRIPRLIVFHPFDNLRLSLHVGLLKASHPVQERITPRMWKLQRNFFDGLSCQTV
jgi:hypothetical protein